MATPKSPHADILKRLLEQQQEGLFTDLEVRLQDGSDRVSRNLFAALCDAFRNMLAHNMVEGRERVVRLEYVTMDTWRCVFQFYFTGKDVLSDSNVWDVLEFSNMFQLVALQENCCSFLMEHCSIENCLAVWRTAVLLNLDSLRDKSMQTMALNFLEVGKQENILELTLQEFLTLLDNENLMTTEDELCSLLLRWMEKNDTSDDSVLSLFDNICAEKLSDSMTVRLLNEDRLHQNTWFYCKLVENQMRMLESATPRTCSPTPYRRGHPQENTVVVGHAGGQLFICSWSTAEKKWSTPCKIRYSREFSSAKVKDTVVITGGHQIRTSRALKRTTLFNLKTGTRSQGPMLNQSRFGHSMAVVGDAVFVVGGETEENYRRSIEMLDGKNIDQWEMAGRLHTPSGCIQTTGVAVLGNKLLVATEPDFEFCIQVFDVITRTTSVLPAQMSHSLSRACYGVSYGDTACLLDDSGTLLLFRQKADNSISYDKRTALQNIAERINYGLSFDGASVTVYGGEDASWGSRTLHSSVSRFDLHGQVLENGDLKKLPLKMRVHGVFRWRSDKPQG